MPSVRLAKASFKSKACVCWDIDMTLNENSYGANSGFVVGLIKGDFTSREGRGELVLWLTVGGLFCENIACRQ